MPEKPPHHSQKRNVYKNKHITLPRCEKNLATILRSNKGCRIFIYIYEFFFFFDGVTKVLYILFGGGYKSNRTGEGAYMLLVAPRGSGAPKRSCKYVCLLLDLIYRYKEVYVIYYVMYVFIMVSLLKLIILLIVKKTGDKKIYSCFFFLHISFANGLLFLNLDFLIGITFLN